MPFGFRTELLDYYLGQLRNYKDVDTDRFIEYCYGFVLIRIMQALGTYGFRGFYEKKPLFLQSIPYAQNNLEWLIDQGYFPGNLAHIKER